MWSAVLAVSLALFCFVIFFGNTQVPRPGCFVVLYLLYLCFVFTFPSKPMFTLICCFVIPLLFTLKLFIYTNNPDIFFNIRYLPLDSGVDTHTHTHTQVLLQRRASSSFSDNSAACLKSLRCQTILILRQINHKTLPSYTKINIYIHDNNIYIFIPGQ